MNVSENGIPEINGTSVHETKRKRNDKAEQPRTSQVKKNRQESIQAPIMTKEYLDPITNLEMFSVVVMLYPGTKYLKFDVKEEAEEQLAKYEFHKKLLLNKIKESKGYTIASDVWTSVRSEHLVNFIILIRNEKPLYYKSINTSHLQMNAETQKRLIVECASELGIEKWLGAIVDNAAVMQVAMELIEKEHPKVFGNGCLAHSVNLFIKNAVRPESVKTVVTKCSTISKFVSNHLQIRTYYNAHIRPKFTINSFNQLFLRSHFTRW